MFLFEEKTKTKIIRFESSWIGYKLIQFNVDVISIDSIVIQFANSIANNTFIHILARMVMWVRSFSLTLVLVSQRTFAEH